MMPEHDFEVYSKLPVWQVRIALAPTIPRELVIDRTYEFEPARFEALRVPTLLLLGGDSPAVCSEVKGMLHQTLPNSRASPTTASGRMAGRSMS